MIQVGWADNRVLKMGVGINKGLFVDKNLFVPDFHHISRDGDHALDVVKFWIGWKLKDDNIVDPRLANRNERLSRKGDFDAIHKLVDENIVANLQGRLHGATGDFEGLHDKGTDEEGHQKRNAQHLNIFAEGRAALPGEKDAHV